MTDSTEYGHIKSYVLRQHRMTLKQKRAYEALMPKFGISFTKDQKKANSFFDSEASLILEIGFGMGHATAEIAAKQPGTNYLGVEVHRPGVGALLAMIEDLQLKNIRIIQHDVIDVLKYMLAPESLDGVHIFFPDPWQKKRHHKRRLIKPEFLDLLLPVLKPGAYMYTVTDWEDYANWILDIYSKDPRIKNQFTDFAPSVPWRPGTSFEKKGLDKNHMIYELLYTKESEHAVVPEN